MRERIGGQQIAEFVVHARDRNVKHGKQHETNPHDHKKHNPHGSCAALRETNKLQFELPPTRKSGKQR